MRQLNRVITLILLVVLAALVVTGCKDDNDDDKLPEARPLLDKAAKTIQDAETFGMELDVSGYPVEIATGDTFSLDFPLVFKYAKGVFVAPDRLQATVEFSVGDAGMTADLIAIGDDQYIRSDILTLGRWLKEEIIGGFSPASLVAEEGGIAAALQSVSDLKMVGKEDLDGLDVYHLSGKIDAANVYALTFGLIGTRSGQLDIDVYVLTDDERVERIVLHEPLPEGVEDQDPTTWTITVPNYNEPYTIDAP
ncbi:MAG: LppX_LprAFG lipoprotein [Anaerolineae bacterium]|nr:LppX_LprAFG lipoprotein [Anaerolineae bacterium]